MLIMYNKTSPIVLSEVKKMVTTQWSWVIIKPQREGEKSKGRAAHPLFEGLEPYKVLSVLAQHLPEQITDDR